MMTLSPVHELSLSYAIVESALESLAGQPVAAVRKVVLAVGELSGVALDALRFSFPLAAAGTPLAGAELVIQSVPPAVYCPACELTLPLASVQHFVCPRCSAPTADLRQGQELILQSLEVDFADLPEPSHAHPHP